MNGPVWSHQGEKRKKRPILYKGCGLDDVYLCSGYEFVQTPEGRGLIVKDADDLHKAIGRYLASKKKALSGKEIRFLRKHMDLSQSDLGTLFGVDSQSVARWEKEQTEIPGPADRLLRAIYIEKECGALDLEELITAIGELDSDEHMTIFENTRKGWEARVGAAA